ncbi:hypothetical protein GF318_05125 [Candidatus Micrarchaeota archaeon]|nr:hypothetical protein [Candidatus Micrarchaeota archaeon]
MKDTGLCDCCYNVTKQLAKTAEFLWHSEKYLEDARRANHTRCAEVFEKIIENEKEHLEMLKELAKNDLC